ncbi:Rv3235 family protein [Helcobacillus massiliensis]|uniref:DUF4440 domain-containing protein n=1 Tax=Helcobacillus massiliensis TaxID=521392 RepID=A0A839QT26_9MICO|nr:MULTISPECIES: Rv3235 family protein [Helcobacillus]MBB3021989.1 hypothetical protein [Helcobacillus massiliensis]MCG7426883.1 Rv3235 family protein [Helcobacillus sp. ACRRO]MCT1557455.1 Rv3235 family protein [Helcobacillus massiliensis]MCT2036364.1 Rv3235 family protein [Helcobacillus massiliensis]MCT2331894.1 Rv3235 family protein [Helcobacillus massiliensis]
MSTAPISSTPAARPSHQLAPSGPFADPDSGERAVTAVARNALEVILGQRPLTSLDQIVDLEVRRRLHERARLIADVAAQRGVRTAARIRVGGVRFCAVTDTAVEANAVISDSHRSRMVVMRWELRRGRWKVVVLDVG